MKGELITIDGFYNNPDQVRLAALSSDFSVKGNYPGARTISYLNDSIKDVIQGIVKPFAGNVVFWGTEYSGAFQYTTKHDRSWVHSDQYNTWAGVCYLAPNAPHSAGTGFFMHKEPGIFRKPHDEELEAKLSADGSDLSKWHLTDVVSNKFNRAVFYRGDLYHSSLDYFGEDQHDGRLFQTFFFDTEY